MSGVLNIDAVRELRVEADGIETRHGPNAYSAYLRKHGKRPGRDEAAIIGRLFGGRVRADDGSMQPALTKAFLKERRERQREFARRSQAIDDLTFALTTLSKVHASDDLAEFAETIDAETVCKAEALLSEIKRLCTITLTPKPKKRK